MMSLRTICAMAAGLIVTCVAHAQRVISDVMPTSQQEPVTWRYTFEKPGDDWTSSRFDDGDWRSGRGGFGTAGTPGISPNTNWSTHDIWLRREVALPATRIDPSTWQLLVFHDEDVEIYFGGVLAARAGGYLRDYE